VFFTQKKKRTKQLSLNMQITTNTYLTRVLLKYIDGFILSRWTMLSILKEALMSFVKNLF
jgi:hypothetical protein